MRRQLASCCPRRQADGPVHMDALINCSQVRAARAAHGRRGPRGGGKGRARRALHEHGHVLGHAHVHVICDVHTRS